MELIRTVNTQSHSGRAYVVQVWQGGRRIRTAMLALALLGSAPSFVSNVAAQSSKPPQAPAVRSQECSPKLRDHVPGVIGQFLDDLLSLPCNIFSNLPTHVPAEPEKARPNQRQAPTAPQLMFFSSSVSDAAATPGSRITISTEAQISAPANVPPLDVRFELVLFSETGYELARAAKAGGSAVGAQLGRYQTEFSLVLPDGVPPGTYNISTYVYVNGVLQKTEVHPLQIAG